MRVIVKKVSNLGLAVRFCLVMVVAVAATVAKVVFHQDALAGDMISGAIGVCAVTAIRQFLSREREEE